MTSITAPLPHAPKAAVAVAIAAVAAALAALASQDRPGDVPAQITETAAPAQDAATALYLQSLGKWH